MLGWQSKTWIKIISIVLIAAFLTYDMAWATDFTPIQKKQYASRNIKEVGEGFKPSPTKDYSRGQACLPPTYIKQIASIYIPNVIGSELLASLNNALRPSMYFAANMRAATAIDATAICQTFRRFKVICSYTLNTSRDFIGDARKGLDAFRSIFGESAVKLDYAFEYQFRDTEAELERVHKDSSLRAPKNTLHLRKFDVGGKTYDINLSDPETKELIADPNSIIYQIVKKTQPIAVSLHFGYSAEKVRFDERIQDYVAEEGSALEREEVLNRVIKNINALRENLARTGYEGSVLLELLNYSDATASKYVTEPDFIKEVLAKTGAGLLIDCAHVLTSAKNWASADSNRYPDFMSYVKDVVTKDNIHLVAELHLSTPKHFSDGKGYHAHLPFSIQNEFSADLRQVLSYVFQLRQECGIQTPIVVNFESDIEHAVEEVAALQEALLASEKRDVAASELHDNRQLLIIPTIISRVQDTFSEIERTSTTEGLESLQQRGIKEKLLDSLNKLRQFEKDGRIVVLNQIRTSLHDSQPLLAQFPEQVAIVVLGGTFDPPHYGHVDAILQALLNVLETIEQEASQSKGPVGVIALLQPNPNIELGPDGRLWKSAKNPFRHRLAMVDIFLEIFHPLIQSARISESFDGTINFRNSLELIGLNWDAGGSARQRMFFCLVCGSDTFLRWGTVLSPLIAEYRERWQTSGVNINVISHVRPGYTIPAERVKGFPCPVVIIDDLQHFELSSIIFRSTGVFSILPLLLQKYIQGHHLYDLTERAVGGWTKDLGRIISSIQALRRKGEEIIQVPGLAGFSVHLIGGPDDLSIVYNSPMVGYCDWHEPVWASGLESVGTPRAGKHLWVPLGLWQDNHAYALAELWKSASFLDIWWKHAETLLAAGKIRRPTDVDKRPTIFDWMNRYSYLGLPPPWGIERPHPPGMTQTQALERWGVLKKQAAERYTDLPESASELVALGQLLGELIVSRKDTQLRLFILDPHNYGRKLKAAIGGALWALPGDTNVRLKVDDIWWPHPNFDDSQDIEPGAIIVRVISRRGQDNLPVPADAIVIGPNRLLANLRSEEAMMHLFRKYGVWNQMAFYILEGLRAAYGQEVILSDETRVNL